MRADLVVVVVLLGAACTGPPQSAPPPRPSAVVSSTAPSSTPAAAVQLEAVVSAAPAAPALPSMPASSSTAWPSTGVGPALPVGGLPSDLINAPPPSPSVTDAPHAEVHGDDGAAIGPAAPGDVATAWTITRSASRFDDPVDDRRHRLAALTGEPAVASAADLAAPRAGPAEGGATWAIVSAVADLGDGWWRISYTLKQTRDGQVGPTSTAATLDVHVGGGLVDAERP